jgi:hypothetical protein
MLKPNLAAELSKLTTKTNERLFSRHKHVQRSLSPGQSVWVKRDQGKHSWVEGEIRSVNSATTYIVLLPVSNQEIVVHADQLRARRYTSPSRVIPHLTGANSREIIQAPDKQKETSIEPGKPVSESVEPGVSLDYSVAKHRGRREVKQPKRLDL